MFSFDMSCYLHGTAEGSEAHSGRVFFHLYVGCCISCRLGSFGGFHLLYSIFVDGLAAVTPSRNVLGLRLCIRKSESLEGEKRVCDFVPAEIMRLTTASSIHTWILTQQVSRPSATASATISASLTAVFDLRNKNYFRGGRPE